jgi:hypothetical protein
VNDKHRRPRRDSHDSVEPPPTTRRAPFDPVEFARESEAKLLAATEVPASNKPTAPPPAIPPMGSIPDVQEVEGKVGARDALGADAIAVLMVARDDVDWFGLSHDATKLLAFVDGVRSLETICAMASVRVEDGAAALLELAEQGMVRFR